MLDEIKDPFFEQDEQKETKLKLQAILDNKAKINGLWYMQGDYIDDAKIISIKNNKILLQGLSGDFYLDIERKSHKISIN